MDGKEEERLGGDSSRCIFIYLVMYSFIYTFIFTRNEVDLYILRQWVKGSNSIPITVIRFDALFTFVTSFTSCASSGLSRVIVCSKCNDNYFIIC